MHDEKCTPPQGLAIGFTPTVVTIEKVENGFIVRVGCKTFVENDWSVISGGLELYFNDPELARRRYCK